MQTGNLLLPAIEKRFGEEKDLAKMSISDVFAESKSMYINHRTFFVANFNAIPNIIQEEKIDCKKAISFLLKTYSKEIKDSYFYKGYNSEKKAAEVDFMYYLLYDDLVVYFNACADEVKFLFRKTPLTKVEILIAEIHKFKKRKSVQKPEISLLIVNPMFGITTKSFPVTKPKLSIDDNYNDDFREIHQLILKRLSKKNDKGLVLLHGKPGTGKTSYIRYLITSLKKEVIFLSPDMARNITDPNFISTLVDNPNSVFVIEDAENIVVDREKNGSSPVSALLNISDGLLADCLSIQIICSFNTDISKIDSALMRKGRLIANYEFKELTIDKAQKLSDKLGHKTNINTPMTLTAIYNQDDKDFVQTKKANVIGFNAINSGRVGEN